MAVELCSECYGIGHVIIPCECCTGKYNHIGQVRCHKCTGNGSQLYECPVCDGTGFESVEHYEVSICV